MNDIEKEKASFEAWCRDNWATTVKDGDGEYMDGRTSALWTGWCAKAVSVPVGLILSGRQGEPAGAIKVFVVYSDGTKIPVIETQANLINHGKKIPLEKGRLAILG
jgi:hypothetical protein